MKLIIPRHPTITDARYYISEINSEGKCQEYLAQYMDEYYRADNNISQLYYPKSQLGKSESSGNLESKEVKHLELMDKKDENLEMAKHYSCRLQLISKMKEVVYMNDDGFARDFMNHTSYANLCNKYAITNPSKYMTDRIIRNMKELVCNHD